MDNINDTLTKSYVEPKFCSQCFTTLTEFVNSGFVGCPNCYKAFASEIKAYVDENQFAQSHKGKLYIKPTHDSILDKISYYEKQLKLAIEEERFEDCRALKNKIISLKEQL